MTQAEISKQEFMNARKILERSYHELEDEYTSRIENNLKTLSNEELIEFLKKSKTCTDFYNSLQLAVKLAANGNYGAIGSNFFRYADPEVAADITAEGRGATHLLDNETDKFFETLWLERQDEYFDMIRKEFPDIKFFKDHFDPIDTSTHIPVYGDTDSLFIEFELIFKSMGLDMTTPVNRICDLIEFICIEILTPFFNEKLKKFATDRNLENYQEFELEVIMRKFISVAKKKYVGTVLWKDGRYKPDDKILKIGGIEIAQSGTSDFVKNCIKKFIYFMVDAKEYDPILYFKIASAIKKKMKTLSPDAYINAKGISDFLTKRVIIDPKTGFQRGVKKDAKIDGIIRYNNLVMKGNLLKYYKKYTSGKVRWYYTEDGGSFAYPIDGEFPSEIAPKPDVDKMAEKLIFAPVKRLLCKVVDMKLDNLGSKTYTKGFKF